MPFKDIEIVGMDDRATPVEPGSHVVRIVLQLSANPPAEWASYFNDRWQNHFYMSKRRASVSGRSLEIACVPSELEKDHMPELQKVVTETNQAYARHALAQEERLQQAVARDSASTQELQGIRDRLFKS